MEFQVLGTLRVVGSGGVEVRLGSAPQRRLLCLLLQSSGEVVLAQQLDDLLELSAGALRTSICRLRRVVGFDTLVTEPPGYRLQCDAIDAVRFEDLLRAAKVDPIATSARATLEQALALWRGRAYAEFAGEGWATLEASRLEGLRTEAVVRLVELLLAAREWTDAVGRLEPLIEEHPFDDRLRALHMRALADSGRRVEALRSFQRYRSVLIEEVGTEPTPATVALDREIAADAGFHAVS